MTDARSGMNRGALVDTFCRSAYNQRYAPFAWEDAPEAIKVTYRELAEDHVSAFIDFVAEWLDTTPLRYEPEPRSRGLARKWREDMHDESANDDDESVLSGLRSRNSQR